MNQRLLILLGFLLAPGAAAQPAVVIEDFEAGMDAVDTCGGATTGAGLIEDTPPDYGGAFALGADFFNICKDCPGDGGIYLRTETDALAGPSAFFNVFVRHVGRPLTIILWDDDNGNGTPDGTDDRFEYELAPLPGDAWHKVSIPVGDFVHAGGTDGTFDPETDGNGGLIGLCFRVDLGPAEGYDFDLDYVAFTEGAALAGEDGVLARPDPTLAVYPNPIGRLDNGAVVTYRQPEAAEVTLTLHDVRGREVARLHEGPLPAGESTFSIGTASLAASAYFVRATGGEIATTISVTVTR